MQFSLREAWYGSGAVPADSLLSVVNCAGSATFEGLADSGRALLGKADTTAQAASLVGRYQVGIATAAAWRYHAEGWSRAEITDWLTQQAVYGDAGWVANRVAFLTAPERATLMWSYWHGEPAIREVLDGVDAPQSRSFLEFLYGRQHSVDSVRMYADA